MKKPQWWLKLTRRTFSDGYCRTIKEVLLYKNNIGESTADLKGKNSRSLSSYDYGRFVAAQQLKDLTIKLQKRGIKYERK